MHLYPINGAAGRVGRNETAFSFRDASFAEVIVGVDPDPSNNERMIAWARDYWLALHPYSAGGAYVNMMMDEGGDAVRASYRDNYARLARIEGEPGILLLDDIEKAHPSVHQSLLQIFDNAHLRLANGKTEISFTNTLIVMTSNVGSEDLRNLAENRRLGFRPSAAASAGGVRFGAQRRTRRRPGSPVATAEHRLQRAE